MKNEKIIAAIIAVVIIIVAAYFLVIPTPGSNVFPFEAGEFKIDITLNYVDGTSSKITPGLSVTYNGQDVESITYTLSAKAETPEGYDPWDSAEINLDYAYTCMYLYNLDGTVYYQDGISFGGCGPHGDIETIPVDGSFYTLYSNTHELEDEFAEVTSGDYYIRIGIEDMGIQYRGVSGSEVGEWSDITPPQKAQYPINIDNEQELNRKVSITFSDDVTWV